MDVQIEALPPVGQLLQAQIHRREAQMAPRDGDAQGDPRVGHDFQALGLAPAGGALLPGIADQPGLEQLRQILVHRGKADLAVPRQALPGAEIPRVVQRAVDAAARRDGAQRIGKGIAQNAHRLFSKCPSPPSLYHLEAPRQGFSALLLQNHFIKQKATNSLLRHYAQFPSGKSGEIAKQSAKLQNQLDFHWEYR